EHRHVRRHDREIGRQLALPEQHRRNDAKRENRLLTSHGTQRELPEKDEYAGDDERDRHDRLDAGGIVVAKRDHWARVPGMRHVRNWAWGHGAWGLGRKQERREFDYPLRRRW